MNGMELAAKAALRSTMLHRIGAVIIGGDGLTLGSGYNTTLSGNPLRYRWSTHAETATVRATVRKNPLAAHRPWTMYVAHINGTGLLRNAMPCHRCQDICRGFSIRVVFSTEHGDERL